MRENFTLAYFNAKTDIWMCQKLCNMIYVRIFLLCATSIIFGRCEDTTDDLLYLINEAKMSDGLTLDQASKMIIGDSIYLRCSSAICFSGAINSLSEEERSRWISALTHKISTDSAYRAAVSPALQKIKDSPISSINIAWFDQRDRFTTYMLLPYLISEFSN